MGPCALSIMTTMVTHLQVDRLRDRLAFGAPSWPPARFITHAPQTLRPCPRSSLLTDAGGPMVLALAMY